MSRLNPRADGNPDSARDPRLFTSESVTEGHPDKVADQISDAILDAFLRRDRFARVACETLVTHGLVVVAGETASTWTPSEAEITGIVRKTVRAIGYTGRDDDFDADRVAVRVHLGRQSPDIGQGVDDGGAGDQGMMFGFACDETPELMPLPIVLARRITARLTHVRKSGELPYLGPDGKAQVTVAYDSAGKPTGIPTVVVSTQHDPGSGRQVTGDIRERVALPCLPPTFRNGNVTVLVNPTGQFVKGGPAADCGLTGRKIIVDTYGGAARHGGGAFSGKDATKVDRSATYMARYVAKNLVAAGLATRAETQIAYAIGRAEPVSVRVDTFRTGTAPDAAIERAVKQVFRLTPLEIIRRLDLRRPIFQATARSGHFGNPEFPWEQSDQVDDLRAALA